VKPNAELGFIFGEETLSEIGLLKVIDLASSLGAKIISPLHTLLKNKSDLSVLKSKFRVIAWTVNEPKRWAQLMEMGVDGIITDYPEALIEFLNGQSNERE